MASPAPTSLMYIPDDHMSTVTSIELRREKNKNNERKKKKQNTSPAVSVLRAVPAVSPTPRSAPASPRGRSVAAAGPGWHRCHPGIGATLASVPPGSDDMAPRQQALDEVQAEASRQRTAFIAGDTALREELALSEAANAKLRQWQVRKPDHQTVGQLRRRGSARPCSGGAAGAGGAEPETRNSKLKTPATTCSRCILV
eukprot:1176724-Prorocentrum_minimum.AAC.1